MNKVENMQEPIRDNKTSWLFTPEGENLKVEITINAIVSLDFMLQVLEDAGELVNQVSQENLQKTNLDMLLAALPSKVLDDLGKVVMAMQIDRIPGLKDQILKNLENL